MSRPHVIVPSPSRDTTRPLRPSARCSTEGQLTGALRPGSGPDTDLGTTRPNPLPVAVRPENLSPVTDPQADRTAHFMHTAEQAAWSLAALSLALGHGGSKELRRSAEELLAVLDLRTEAEPDLRPALAGQAASPLLQDRRPAQ